MRMKLWIIIGSLFFFTMSSMAQDCARGDERIKSINSEFENEVLKLTNIERKKRGLSPLKMNKMLSYSARYHAKDMAEENYFEHDSFDRKKNGKLVKSCGTFDRIEAFISFSYLAENISAGQHTPESVLNAWMNSPGHKKNILNKNFTEIGIAYYYSDDSEYNHYWVQNFGGDK